MRRGAGGPSRWLRGLLGGAAVVALWWVLAVTVFTNPSGRRSVPTPLEVAVQYAADGWSFYVPNFAITIREALTGYVWGNGIAVLLAALVLVVPRLEGVVTQIATITYCLPIVAIGGIAVVVVGAPGEGAPSGTAVLLAGMSVFFTTVISALLGLKSADPATLDVVAVNGGSRLMQLRKVRLISALPQLLYGLQIAVPASVLGAVLGEFFGKVEFGVGPAMIVAQQNLEAARLWGIALAIGALAVVGFNLIGIVARVVAPWSRGRQA